MRIREFRSDTFTKPTDAMRKAMYEAEVGDDVYDEDPTVNRLQEMGAARLGKEAALFVPSGTAGNQCAIGSHISPGWEVIAGEDSHVVQHESGAPAALWGAQMRSIAPERTTFLTPSDLEPRLRIRDNVHEPLTGLIILENALSDGSVMPLGEMKKVSDLARAHKIKLHLDGARLFHAAVSTGVDVKEFASTVDSVMICLSKGLGAPVGSLLAGDAAFIKEAHRKRKMLGGGMRQVGVLAAPGIVALSEGPKQIAKDQANARLLAELLAEIPIVSLNLDLVQTNIIFFKIESPNKTDDDFVSYMNDRGFNVNEPMHAGIRVVTCYEIDEEDVRAFAKTAREFAKK